MEVKTISDLEDGPKFQGLEAPLTLWLADDHQPVLSLVADLLGKTGQISCAREFNSAEALLDALMVETAPDVVLMDVNMGGMTGVEAITPIKKLSPSTRVFIMTTFYDHSVVSGAREAGAAGFFLKSGDWDEAFARLINPATDWKQEAPVTCSAQIEPKLGSELRGKRPLPEAGRKPAGSDNAPAWWLRAGEQFRQWFQRPSMPLSR